MSGKRLRPRPLLIALIAVLALAALLAGGTAVYAADYSRANDIAVACMAANADTAGGDAAFGSAAAETVFIFYPGGKVDYAAYAPLMEALSQRGVRCVIARMPLNLAVLDSSAALAVMARETNAKRFVIGGHSLGGAMAAAFAAKHPDRVCGAVLLAAYPTAPLAVPVLSVTASEDGVLDRAAYEEGRAYMPADFTEVVIQGGNHAQFGSYGPQDGDRPATLTERAQQAETVDAIVGWLTAHGWKEEPSA